jgi:hypothetical protein
MEQEDCEIGHLRCGHLLHGMRLSVGAAVTPVGQW